MLLNGMLLELLCFELGIADCVTRELFGKI